MKTIAQSIIGKTAEWDMANPVLFKGMIGFEIRPDGSRRMKIGDGKRNWNDPELKAFNTNDIEGLRNELDQAAEMVQKMKDVFAINKTLEEIMGEMSPEDFENIAALLFNIQGQISMETDERVRIIEALEERVETLTSQLNKSRPRIVGEYCDLSYEMTDAELAANRLLKLEGQKILVADYEELVEKKGVGREANVTALFNYKCNENGVRNPDGLFFVVEDWRGMFGRVAGVNSVLRTDMNNPLSSPYDGKQIGEFERDEQQPIGGYFYLPQWETGNPLISVDTKLFTIENSSMAVGVKFDNSVDRHKINFNSANVVRTGSVNKPPSISEARYIYY
jgi:hypothetical protein